MKRGSAFICWTHFLFVNKFDKFEIACYQNTKEVYAKMIAEIIAEIVAGFPIMIVAVLWAIVIAIIVVACAVLIIVSYKRNKINTIKIVVAIAMCLVGFLFMCYIVGVLWC